MKTFITHAGASLAGAAVVICPAAAVAQAQNFNVGAQPIADAVVILSRQGGAQIRLSPDVAPSTPVRGVSGRHSLREALALSLEDSGLQVREEPSGGFTIFAASAAADREPTFLPEVLVSSTRWSLNTGIARSADDAQPFIVISREEILRSGAVSLDVFLRNALSAATGASTSEQGASWGARGVSRVNLRGLGTDETLILIDGRRVPGPNLANGLLEQGSIKGIPLSAIERIEVLASSASGIYGGSATGGVLNIILRRDYQGLELTTAYSDTYEGGGGSRRVDLGGGRAFGEGRTRVSFSAGWQENDPLTVGERGLYARGLRHMSAVHPSFQTGQDRPPLGATPNILSGSYLRNGSLSPLVLKSAFGGQSLGATTTHVPYGYRGLALDGVAGLIANAGRYNLDLADVAAPSGAKGTYLTASKEYSGQLSIRHELSSWASLYGEAAASRVDTSSLINSARMLERLSSSSPNNPFRQTIYVSIPGYGADYMTADSDESRRLVAGAILKLRGEWQAVADLSWAWAKRTPGIGARVLDRATSDGFISGSLPAMSDTGAHPLTYGYLENPMSVSRLPAETTVRTASLRLAGPAPVSLPGGKPVVTMMVERSERPLAAGYEVINSPYQGWIRKVPARELNTNSAYMELRAPIIGANNRVFLVREFEVQASARYDVYDGTGAAPVVCLETQGPLPSELAPDFCDAQDAKIEWAKTSSDRIDPMISARWKPFGDIALRASYATSFTPPALNNLNRNSRSWIFTDLKDSLRGGERLGEDLGGLFAIKGPNYGGGNADLRPEKSKSVSFGVIYTPSAVSGLRLSADWTRIEKNDDHYDPSSLLTPGRNQANRQSALNQVLAAYPERFTRAAPSDGYSVGKITGVDLSWMNLAGSTVEAADFTLDYSFSIAGGQLDVTGRATWLRDMSLRLAQFSEPQQYAGVLDNVFQREGNGNGGLEWRGNLTAVWSNDRATLGGRVTYFDSYFLDVSRAVIASQGAAYIRAQRYFDLFGSYRLTDKTQLNFNISNLFNTRPPVDVTADELYSRFGDPRGAAYTLSIRKSF